MSTMIAETTPAATAARHSELSDAPRPLAEYQAELIERAKSYGLGFSIGATDDGPLYVVHGIDNELVVRTLDIEAAHEAIAEYWPEARLVGEAVDCGLAVKVELMPAYDGCSERVILSAAPGVRDEFTQIAELRPFAAGALAQHLISALTRIADPSAFGR